MTSQSQTMAIFLCDRFMGLPFNFVLVVGRVNATARGFLGARHLIRLTAMPRDTFPRGEGFVINTRLCCGLRR